MVNRIFVPIPICYRKNKINALTSTVPLLCTSVKTRKVVEVVSNVFFFLHTGAAKCVQERSEKTVVASEAHVKPA